MLKAVTLILGATLLWLRWIKRAATGTPDSCSFCDVIFTHASEGPDWWEPTAIMWYKPTCCNRWVCEACIYGVDQDLLADDRFCRVCVSGTSRWRRLWTPGCSVLGSNTYNVIAVQTLAAAAAARTPPPPRRSTRRCSSPAHNKARADSSSTHKTVLI
jgi:hypothetical protein